MKYILHLKIKCYKNKWTIGPTTADSHCRWTSTQALLFLFHYKRRQLLKSFVLWCKHGPSQKQRSGWKRKKRGWEGARNTYAWWKKNTVTLLLYLYQWMVCIQILVFWNYSVQKNKNKRHKIYWSILHHVWFIPVNSIAVNYKQRLYNATCC